MSTGSGIGAVVGAIIGIVIGTIFPGIGNVYGGYIGAMIGFGIGYAIDPMKVDVNQPGVPLQQLQLPSNIIGSVIPDALGTVKIAGTFLCFGQERAVPTYQKSGGKGGGGSSKVLTGYKYYMSWAQGLSRGPVDTLCAIYENNDELIWSGELNRPSTGGKETIVINNCGTISFYFGTDDQAPNATMGKIIGDASLNSPLRGLCYAVFQNYYIGNYNRCPAMKFVFKKNNQLVNMPTKYNVGEFDYNPIHALYYVLNDMVGLPTEWLHTESFIAAASVIYDEGRGVSVCFDQHQTALTYIETLNLHANNILRYGSDGKFHAKLIRGDYVAADLPLVDESIILADPNIARRNWIDTVNEMKVQYSEIFKTEK